MNLFQVKELEENILKLRAKKCIIGNLIKRRKNTYFVDNNNCKYYANFDNAFSKSSVISKGSPVSYRIPSLYFAFA